MFRKKIKKEPYDKTHQIPVIRGSICTGEKVAGFRNVETGTLTEVMLIRDDKDMKEFLEKYDVSPDDIKYEW